MVLGSPLFVVRTTPPGLVLAGIVLVTAPTAVIFSLLRRQLIAGLATGSVKS